MTTIVQDAIDALSLGGLYALAALGIALIFGVMRLINFAQGALIMVGGYILWWLASAWWGVTAVAVVLMVAALAVVIERVAFRPVRNADAATLLVTSFFVSSLLQNSAILAFGSFPKGVSVFPGLLTNVQIGSIQITTLDIVTLGVATCSLAGVALLLRRTLLGVQIRASSEDFTMARLLGVRANRVIAAAFAISGVLAALVSMMLIASVGTVDPNTGLEPVLIGFVATVLGGMGSLVGAVVAAFALGAITTAFQVTLPAGAVGYRDAFVFIAVIALLIWKPTGFFPVKGHGDRV